ncbi:MAG: DUF3800 domain-containing protein, partial [Chloroflexi bacterium]|nr:DUF3800 domain-containing protein [Chloroflexota bacterium]
MTIRIYVDWSGDPGFKFRQGSSELFVVAAVLSDEELQMNDLRIQLSLPEDFEFHYSKADRSVRERFKNHINNELEFPGIVILRVDKQRLPLEMRQKRGEQVMADLIALCVSGLPPELLHNAILFYDGEKEQQSFKNTLRAALSESMQPGIFLRNIKAVPAKRIDGLQIADMLAGFIRSDPFSIRSSMVKIIQYP